MLKSKSQVKRLTVQSPEQLERECLKLIMVNARLRDALAIGLDAVFQLQDQGIQFLPAEIDTFYEAATEAIAFAQGEEG